MLGHKPFFFRWRGSCFYFRPAKQTRERGLRAYGVLGLDFFFSFFFVPNPMLRIKKENFLVAPPVQREKKGATHPVARSHILTAELYHSVSTQA